MPSSVIAIETAVQQLHTSDLAQFRKWFAQFDAKNWDEQIEQDASFGKFDDLASEALTEFHAGLAKEI
jgi:hypothetical protein